MPLKIWSLLAGTSIALQSIRVLISILLLFLRCCLGVPTDPQHPTQGPGTMVRGTRMETVLQGDGDSWEITQGHQAMEAQIPRSW